MTKIMRQVTLEYDLWEQAKRAGFNVSECCERGLRLVLKNDAAAKSGAARRTRIEIARDMLTAEELSFFRAGLERWKKQPAGRTARPHKWIRRRIRELVGIALTEHELEGVLAPAR